MLSFTEILLPLLFIILISLPMIKVFQGKTTKKAAKNRLLTHVFSFFGFLAFTLVYMFSNVHVFAADTTIIDITGTTAQGLGFLSAALSTGLSALGAGIAVAAAAPAAIGAFSENEKNFGKSLIFVALGEGVAIYGLIISALIYFKL